MKLKPKGAKFCPGCPKKLSLKPAPQLIIKEETQTKASDSKTITIINTGIKKAINGLF